MCSRHLLAVTARQKRDSMQAEKVGRKLVWRDARKSSHPLAVTAPRTLTAVTAAQMALKEHRMQNRCRPKKADRTHLV